MSSKLLNVALLLALVMLVIVLASPWQTLTRIGSYVSRLIGYQ